MTANSCTEMVDSMFHHYDPSTGHLDSITGFMRGIDSAASLRREIYTYSKLPNGNTVKDVSHFITADGKWLFRDVYQYGPDGKEIDKYSTTNWTYPETCINKYDSKGNRNEWRCLNAGGHSTYYTYKYDKKNRKVSERNESRRSGEYHRFAYSEFDSVVAVIKYFSTGDSALSGIHLYDKDRRARKRIGYDFIETKKPIKIWLDAFDPQGRIIQTLFISDTTGGLETNPKSFGVMHCEWKTYDDKGRLQTRIAKRRPFPP
jgi:hypothetical protein